MKKQKLNKLSLNKKVVSNLNATQEVKGGATVFSCRCVTVTLAGDETCGYCTVDCLPL